MNNRVPRQQKWCNYDYNTSPQGNKHIHSTANNASKTPNDGLQKERDDLLYKEVCEEFYKTPNIPMAYVVQNAINQDIYEPHPFVTKCNQTEPKLSHMDPYKTVITPTKHNQQNKHDTERHERECPMKDTKRDIYKPQRMVKKVHECHSTSKAELKSRNSSTQTSDLISYLVNSYTLQLEKLLDLSPKTHKDSESEDYFPSDESDFAEDSDSSDGKGMLSVTVYTQTVDTQLSNCKKKEVYARKQKDTFRKAIYKKIIQKKQAIASQLISAYNSVWGAWFRKNYTYILLFIVIGMLVFHIDFNSVRKCIGHGFKTIGAICLNEPEEHPVPKIENIFTYLWRLFSK